MGWDSGYDLWENEILLWEGDHGGSRDGEIKIKIKIKCRRWIEEWARDWMTEPPVTGERTRDRSRPDVSEALVL